MHSRLRPSPAMIVALIALFVALGGSAAALSGSNTVFTDDIANDSFNSPTEGQGGLVAADLRASSVGTSEVALNSLGAGDLAPNSVGSSELTNGAVIPAKCGTIPAARVKKSSNQSIPNSTKTKLTFDNESFDTAALHDTSVNNTRLTAPISGVYQVNAGVTWTAGPTAGVRIAFVAVNGGCTGAPADLTGCFGGASQSPAGPNRTHQTISELLKLTAGDFVEVTAAHNAGAPIGVEAVEETFLAMNWVGPG